MRLLAVVLLCASLAAQAHSFESGELQVRHPWSRETPPASKTGVAYMEIRNRGSTADRLLGASSPAAGRVEMHITRRENDVVRMRQVQSVEIPGRQRVELRPSGAHLMLVDLKQPLKKGERLQMTLRFERAGELQIELDVQDLGARHPRH